MSTSSYCIVDRNCANPKVRVALPFPGSSWGWGAVAVTLCVILTLAAGAGIADAAEDSLPIWEPLLWGGHIQGDSDSISEKRPVTSATAPPNQGSPPVPEYLLTRSMSPTFLAGLRPAIYSSKLEAPKLFRRDPIGLLRLKNIPPLYLEPRLADEGVWEWQDMPKDPTGQPVMYRASYRPSASFPTAIVHMLLLDMKQLSMRLYIGSSEPGSKEAVSRIEPERTPYLLAITNALWKQKHSGNAGAVFRGKVLNKMVPGMATIVIYKDDSVDILEWNDNIPISSIRDARQLRHLILKNGAVVDSVVKEGVRTDSEIGLGYLLVEDYGPDEDPWRRNQPQAWNPYAGYYGNYGGGYTHTSGPEWFIATRSAFGIRPDGNLVFAIGHHIGTKDLAKALALAGCVRAIHGDANPHNVLGNLYYSDRDGRIIRAEKLSPMQKDQTLRRYVDRSYTSDFFAFYRKGAFGLHPSGPVARMDSHVKTTPSSGPQ